MPTVTNKTDSSFDMPAVHLVFGPHESHEVDDATAAELDGHPLLTVTWDAPQPEPEAETPPAATEE